MLQSLCCRKVVMRRICNIAFRFAPTPLVRNIKCFHSWEWIVSFEPLLWNATVKANPLYIVPLTRLVSYKTRKGIKRDWSRLWCYTAAVSWARIERCGPADLDGYKAARAPTLSASQLNSVSRVRRERGQQGREEMQKNRGGETGDVFKFVRKRDWSKRGMHVFKIKNVPFLCRPMLLSSATENRQQHS